MDSKERRAVWHTLSPEALCAELATDPASGLTDEEARRRLLAHGPNELPAATPISPLAVFLRQFAGMIVWVLVGAAVVSGLLQEWIDAAAIAAIVVLNAVLGFVQEYKAGAVARRAQDAVSADGSCGARRRRPRYPGAGSDE